MAYIAKNYSNCTMMVSVCWDEDIQSRHACLDQPSCCCTCLKERESSTSVLFELLVSHDGQPSVVLVVTLQVHGDLLPSFLVLMNT